MITGAGGLLGSNLVVLATERGWDVISTYHSPERTGQGPAIKSIHLDVSDAEQIGQAIQETSPDYVINCAAMTDVDGCENNPEHARDVNAGGPAVLAAQCMETGAGFCQISTDYVLGDGLDMPISESAPTEPLQVYGRTKLDGERWTQENHPRPLIVRLSFLFGIHRTQGTVKGLPGWILDRIRADRDVPLYTDQRITPTYAGDAAKTVLGLIERSTKGLLHGSNRGCTTPYEFGRNFVNRYIVEGGPDLLLESSMEGIDRLADRPSSVCLSVEAVESELGRIQPTWYDAVRRMVRELEDNELVDGSK